MTTTRRTLLGAGLGLVAGAAHAQAPALAGLGGDDKSRLQATIDAAKREGQLVYIEAVINDDSAEELARGFRAHYGLPSSFTVRYSQVNTGVIATRLEQELGANRMGTDVVGLAIPNWVLARVAAGDIMRYDSPEYPRYRRVFEQGLGRDGYFAFNGAYFFSPSWNSETLNFSGTSWNDVIGAVPNGRLNMGNAETSLAHLVTFIGVRRTMGEDFYPKIAAMKPRIIQAGEMAHDNMMTGQDLLSLYGQPTHIKHRNDLGAKMKIMLPTEGVVLLPQCLFIMAKAPHPNAAKLWLDYMLSAAGQKVIIEREAMLSGREGAPTALAGYPLTLETLKTIPVDWGAITPADLAKARADWVRLFKS